MVARKSLETMSDMILNRLQPKFAAKLVANGSGGKVQVWVQVQAPACHLEITSEGYSRRQSKVLTTILHSKKQLPVAKHVKSYAIFFS